MAIHMIGLMRVFTAGFRRSREFLSLFLFLAVLTVSSAFFYMKVKGWSFIDSLYFVVVTITTVGYGDLSPHTDQGKLFTIMLILTGVGTAVTFVNALARRTLEYQKESLKNMRRFLEQEV